MEISNLIKKQEEELYKILSEDETTIEDISQLNSLKKTEKKLDNFIQKARKEWTIAVCNKMIGKRRKIFFNSDRGYNERIKEEKEIKKQIIKEL